jgi:hypothetical protein
MSRPQMSRTKPRWRRDHIFYGMLIIALVVCLSIPLWQHFRAMLFPKAQAAEECFCGPQPPLFVTGVER